MRAALRRAYVGLRMTLALAVLNGVVAARRNPLWVLSYMIAPLGILLFFSLWGGESFARWALIGGLTAMAVSNGVGLMGDVAFYKNHVKLQDMVVASPMGPLHYMMGLALSGFFFSLPGLAVMWVLLVALHGPSLLQQVTILAIYVTLAMLTAGIGFTLATFVREERFAWPLSSILSFMLLMAPSVYYPHTVLPHWASALAVLIPSSSAAMLMHKTVGNISTLPLPVALVVLTAALETALFFWLALTRSRWRER